MNNIINLQYYKQKRLEASMKQLVYSICEMDCYRKTIVINPYHKNEPESNWYAEKSKELGVICLPTINN